MEKRLEKYYRAIEAGAEMEHLIRPLNDAGRLKKELEDRLARQVLPFQGISKKDVLAYLRSQKGLSVPRQDTGTCKRIVENHVNRITVWNKEKIHIELKYQLSAGMSKAGGGGGPPAQTYCLVLT